MFYPLNPEEILIRLNLKSDMLAADFGSGSGSFTIPLAKKLRRGLVYAIDIQEPTLSSLKSTALFKKINNIQAIHSDLEKANGSKINDSYLDLVLIINTLFQVEDKDAIIKEAGRVLKKEGQLLIIEPFNFKNLVEEQGFKVKKRLGINNYFAIVFEKNNLETLNFRFD